MANKIEAAVAPLKADAIAWAEREARGFIGRVEKELEANGWRIEIVAPFPKGNHWTAEVQAARAKYHLYGSLVQPVSDFTMRQPGDPYIVEMAAARTAHFVQEAMDAAAARYDAFVRKLAGKIGEVQDATLTGNHVWSHSLLTVTKPDGGKETWRTQQIVNVSKLGKPFNQWPSRKLEARQRGARR